jgi:hypothetical protein
VQSQARITNVNAYASRKLIARRLGIKCRKHVARIGKRSTRVRDREFLGAVGVFGCLFFECL